MRSWLLSVLGALERAIEALKQRAAARHYEASQIADRMRARGLRAEADADDKAAEEIKRAIREEERERPDPPEEDGS